MTTKASLFDSLRGLADEIGGIKSAAHISVANNNRVKKAEGPVPADPGGYQGPSDHPITKTPNSVQESTEGARSSENEADVKADQRAPGVNNATDATPGSQDKVQLNIGTQQSATGEDPSVEDKYKDNKDDPGTSHPSDVSTNDKYASFNFSSLKAASDNLANQMLADMANGQKLSAKSAAASCATPMPAAKGGAKPAAGAKAPAAAAAMPKAAAVNSDFQAGYDLAAQLGVEKAAAAQQVAGTIEATIAEACFDADLFGSYYVKAAQYVKAAAGEGAEGEEHDKPGDAESGAGPAEGGKGGGEAPPSAPAPPGGEGGGASLGDALGGGADPGGLAGGGAPPEAKLEHALTQLVAALDEMGVPIDGGELAGGAGGAPPVAPPGAPPPGADPTGGGAPPMGGGAPPGGMSEGMKLASAALAFRRSGKYRFKEAADGTPDRILRDQMKQYVKQLLTSAA